MTKKRHLIWLDLEMTGLDPDKDRIIEMGFVATDYNLEVQGELGPVIISQSKELLDGMDDWNKKTHSKSGLIEKVLGASLDEAGAEEQALEFVSRYCEPKESPMCGNSICQDRRFLYRYMPRLEDFFHYRNLDVSALKEVIRIWRSEGKPFAKHGKHEALADVIESIEELRFYLNGPLGAKLGETDFNSAAR